LHPAETRRKLLKRFVASLILAFALSSVALAGDIPSGGAPAPNPTGDLPATSSIGMGEAPEETLEQYATQTLLSLLAIFGFLKV
jgi:hypothetical protein